MRNATAISWREQVTFDGDYICFVLSQHPSMDFYGARSLNYSSLMGHRGRDRMVVGYTTTYAIGAYHH